MSRTMKSLRDNHLSRPRPAGVMVNFSEGTRMQQWSDGSLRLRDPKRSGKALKTANRRAALGRT